MEYSIIIIIILSLIFIYFISFKESFATIPINDIFTDEKIPLIVNGMLRDIHHLFNKYNISYQFHNNKTFILRKDEIQFTRLIPILYEMGYNLVDYKGSYKIYPLNSISYKNTNDDINYRFPNIDIIII